jgi:pimeloyl-ACP methyl ester carboxylesterase
MEKKLRCIFLLIIVTFFLDCKKDTNSSYLLFYKDIAGVKKPIKNQSDWEMKRQQVVDSMQQAMGELPDISSLPEFDIQITDSLKTDNYTRLTISFKAEENERVHAYLYIPFQEKPEKKLPAMLALHQTEVLGKRSVDGQGTYANLAYAKELAQRGFVVIAPDYPSFGDSKNYDFENDRYKSGTMKGVFDNMRCADLLQSRKEVDPERIGIIGHSLGGHNAIFTSVFDERFKVIVSSCGWTLLDYYDIGEEAENKFGGRLGPWAQNRYMPLLRDKYNLKTEKIPFDFDEVIAALAPRAFFSNSPVHDVNFNVKGVQKGIEAITMVYHFLGAEDKLQVHYPNCGHDFPPEVRFQAYEFIEKTLKH